jgi:hypothetical protein
MIIGDDQDITGSLEIPAGASITGLVIEGSDEYSTVFILNAIILNEKHLNTIILASYKKKDRMNFSNTSNESVWITYYAYDDYENEDSKVKTVFEITLN